MCVCVHAQAHASSTKSLLRTFIHLGDSGKQYGHSLDKTHCVVWFQTTGQLCLGILLYEALNTVGGRHLAAMLVKGFFYPNSVSKMIESE